MLRVLNGRRGRWAVAAVVAASACAGCGGNDESRPVSAGSITSSSAPTSASAPTSSAAVASTAAPSTTVVPAAGPTLTSPSMTLNLPAGWVEQGSSRLSPNGFDPSGQTGGMVHVIDESTAFGAESTAYDTRLRLKELSRERLNPVQQVDVTVNGVDCAVLSGHNFAYPVLQEYLTVRKGHSFLLEISFSDKTPQAQSITDSILASVVWR